MSPPITLVASACLAFALPAFGMEDGDSQSSLSTSLPSVELPVPVGVMVMDLVEPMPFSGPMTSEPTEIPGIFMITASPLGIGTLEVVDQDAGTYAASLGMLDFVPVPVTYDPAAMRFDFSGAGATGSFQLEDISYAVPIPAPCPPELRGGVFRNSAGLPGCAHVFDAWGLPFVHTVEWVQFASLTVTVGSDDLFSSPFPGNDPSWEEVLPLPGGFDPAAPGWPVSGNGNTFGGPSSADPVTGRGFARGDGSRVYVDAPVGSGALPETAQDGSTTSVNSVPQPPADFGNMAAVFDPYNTWATWRLDLWTYLVIDGEPVYVVQWHSEWKYYRSFSGFPWGPELPPTSEVDIDGQGPVEGFSPAHQQALNQHQSGNYSGAPR